MSEIVFAGVSSLLVKGNNIEGAVSCNISFPKETRPIYTFNSIKPVLILNIRTLGSGSFSYIASDGQESSCETDWSTILNGDVNSIIQIDGKTYPNNTPCNISISNVTFNGQSATMNARGEMVVTVNFTFKQS